MSRYPAFIPILLALAACPAEEGEPSDVTWETKGLQPLGEDHVYEGFVYVDGAPVSVGRFSVGEDGTPEVTSAPLSATQTERASTFVLTVEPEPDDDPAPSRNVLLAGDFRDGAADLRVDHEEAFGTDFTALRGTYVLNTPTTAGVEDDYAQGIWWLDPNAGPGPSLELEELPEGWTYEGWIVAADGRYLSTGRFLQASGEDSDGAGLAAGPDPAPAFPGQDYVDPPLSLVGLSTLVSIEPEPDDSEDPFVLQPLVDQDIEDVGEGTSQQLMNQAGSTNPTGTATIE